MGDLETAIGNAEICSDPFPYFIANNVLSPNMLRLMHSHWPPRNAFFPELPYHYVHPILLRNLIHGNPLNGLFWLLFKRTMGHRLCRAVVQRFSPWIEKRYGSRVPLSFYSMSLMESDSGFAGHGCHTHHYHDPFWVGTLLLYLEDGTEGFPGTTVYRTKMTCIEDEAHLAAQTLSGWGGPEFEEAKTAEYRCNRLFAMYDSPISYHGVKGASPSAKGARRIFRAHISAPDSFFQTKYGVTPAEYRRLRREKSEDPLVLGWLRKDIEELRSVRK